MTTTTTMMMSLQLLLQVTLHSDAPGAFLGAYSYILLAGGDLNFTRESGNSTLPDELLHALLLSEDTRLLLQAYHVRALKSAGRWEDLNATGAHKSYVLLFDCDTVPPPAAGRVEVLEAWVNPVTGRCGVCSCSCVCSAHSHPLQSVSCERRSPAAAE
jgi:hypothetical protein